MEKAESIRLSTGIQHFGSLQDCWVTLRAPRRKRVQLHPTHERAQVVSRERRAIPDRSYCQLGSCLQSQISCVHELRCPLGRVIRRYSFANHTLVTNPSSRAATRARRSQTVRSGAAGGGIDEFVCG